ncbi:MAG: PEP-CTERM sorting domain-containing protein [Motiliproteus sp.]
MKPVISLLFLINILLPLQSTAGVISQESYTGITTIYAARPGIGQSFTAEDQNVSIAFSFSQRNSGEANTPITLSLLEGEGFSGTLLGSVEFTIPDNLFISSAGFYDIDFRHIDLVVGSKYSAVLSVPSGSFRWGVSNLPDDVYSGGVYLSGGLLQSNYEAAFRIVPSVPEPSSFLILASGLLCFAGLRKRLPTRSTIPNCNGPVRQ